MATMNTPAYYDSVPAILMMDPLARTLGSAEDGLIEYRYLDAVKLTGHSCPTVAGAWQLTHAALARLYPDSTPVRSHIRVEFRQPLDEGVVGVIANLTAWFALHVLFARVGVVEAGMLRLSWPELAP